MDGRAKNNGNNIVLKMTIDKWVRNKTATVLFRTRTLQL